MRPAGIRASASGVEAGRGPWALAGLALLVLPALVAAASQEALAGSARPADDPAGLFPDDSRSFFAGVQVGRRSLDGGDLDGRQIISEEDRQILIPALEPALMVGLDLGARSGAWALGLGYAWASHDWSWRGEAQDPARTASRLAHLEVRYHVLTGQALQPFLQAGFIHSRLAVQAGRIDATSGAAEDLTLVGWGGVWGAGVDLYPSASFRLTVGVRRHHGFHDRQGSDKLPRSVSSAGLDVYFAASLRVAVQSFTYAAGDACGSRAEDRRL